MKKPKKWLYILGAVLLLLPLAGLLSINLYIQSAPFKSNLEKTLARSLSLRLRIQEITFAPWSGLRATADSLAPDGQPVEGAPKTTMVADLRLFPLINKQVILDRVTLFDPRAEWILGDEEAPGALGEGDAKASDNASLAAPGSVPLMAGFLPQLPLANLPVESAPAAASDETTGSGNSVVVLMSSIRVERGELVIRENGKPDLGLFRGITLVAFSNAPGEYDGNITVKEALLLGHIPLNNLETPVEYRPTSVKFSNIESEVGGGRLEGKLSFQDIDKKPRFSTDLDFYDIKLSGITPAGDERMKFESGKLQGGIRMEGELENWQGATGTAEMVVSDAQFSRDSMISRVGQLFKIDELTNLSAKRVWVSGKLENGEFSIEKGELKSDSVLLIAGGTVKSDGRLRLAAQLHLNNTLSEKIPKALTEELKPSPVEGFSFIDFAVRGPINKPRTDLVDRLFPAKNEPLSLLIRSFFPEQTRLLPEDEDEGTQAAPDQSTALPETVPPAETPAIDVPAAIEPPAPEEAPAPTTEVEPAQVPAPMEAPVEAGM